MTLKGFRVEDFDGTTSYLILSLSYDKYFCFTSYFVVTLLPCQRCVIHEGVDLLPKLSFASVIVIYLYVPLFYSFPQDIEVKKSLLDTLKVMLLPPHLPHLLLRA